MSTPEGIDPRTMSPAAAIYYDRELAPRQKIDRLRDEIGQTEEAMGYCSSLLRQFPELMTEDS